MLYVVIAICLLIALIIMAFKYEEKRYKKLKETGYEEGLSGAIKLMKEGKGEDAVFFLRYYNQKLNPKVTNESTEDLLKGVIYSMDLTEYENEAFNAHFPPHAETLARKCKQLINVDEYGVIDSSRWDNELSYFIENVIEARLPLPYNLAIHPSDLRFCSAVGFELDEYIDETKASIRKTLFDRIDKAVIEFIDSENEVDDFYENDPIAYEMWCSEQIRKIGWNARLTPSTNDQGADIIAEKDGIKLALQCKFYSSPVGNKAVQEVAASLSFYGANYGAVVSNATFTKSAQALANSTRVKLLHHAELCDLVDNLS